MAPLFGGGTGAGNDLLDRFKVVNGAVRAVMHRLGTKGAVFRASTRFGINYRTEGNAVPLEMLPYALGSGEHIAEIRPFGAQQGQAFIGTQRAAGQYPFGPFLYSIQHSPSPVSG